MNTDDSISVHYPYEDFPTPLFGNQCVDSLIAGIRKELPSVEEDEIALLRKAYDLAFRCHEGQCRKSGSPYFEHPYAVAQTLVEWRMDIETVCAGLLHDVVEDTAATNLLLEREFGREIAFLVDGVTKLGRLALWDVEQHQAENYRKMIVATVRDPRVLLVKFADRLHNIQTIEYMKPDDRKRIARETLEIYAPLSHRLGMAQLRAELEDLSFKALDPDNYRDIARRVQEKRADREAYIKEMTDAMRGRLLEAGIHAQVIGRPKHLYSIYQKMTVRRVPFENIYDLFGFRVLVETDSDCYLALGIIHKHWIPIPDRFKDYVSVPKTNMYQSLHTAIIDRGRPIEVQIRTSEMHRVAEMGIAAHWRYKEKVAGRSPVGSSDRFALFRQLLEHIQDVENSRDFLQAVRGELFEEEIYAFTPKGAMKVFRKGATPIDFAFAIHTDIGLHTSGAKINGRIVPLKTEIRSGDRVEILTDPEAHPSRDWLRLVKTARARNKIKYWLRAQEFEQAVQLGKRLIEAELRLHQKNPKVILKEFGLEELAEKFEKKGVEEFLADVGYGHISPQRVYQILVPPVEREEEEEKVAKRPLVVAVTMDGFSHAVTRVAKCCSPIPGDDVVGFVSRGRGVMIHARECPRLSGESERLVSIEWQSGEHQTYSTDIVVESADRKALLADIATAISQKGVNIHKSIITTPDSFTAINTFNLDVRDTKQLKEVMEAIAKVRGVRYVRRRRKG